MAAKAVMLSMNKIKLLFFATIRDRVGTKSLELDIPVGLTVLGLKEKLSADFPNLKDSMKSVLVAINHEYVFDDAVVPIEAEVGMFPPVSGG
jgi:MoaE-MoaD fusion protein